MVSIYDIFHVEKIYLSCKHLFSAGLTLTFPCTAWDGEANLLMTGQRNLPMACWSCSSVSTAPMRRKTLSSSSADQDAQSNRNVNYACTYSSVHLAPASLWLDQLPSLCLSRGFSFIKGNSKAPPLQPHPQDMVTSTSISF